MHYDQYCDYEWTSNSEGVVQTKDALVQTSCDFPPGKIKLLGDYKRFQCGIQIANLTVKDRGLWLCEIEKYYTGFSRR